MFAPKLTDAIAAPILEVWSENPTKQLYFF